MLDLIAPIRAIEEDSAVYMAELRALYMCIVILS